MILKDCWFRYESPAFLHFTLIWYDFTCWASAAGRVNYYIIIMICRFFFSKVLGKIVRYFYAEVPSRQRPVGHWRIWGQKSPSEFFKLGGSDVDGRCTAASAACCAAWRGAGGSAQAAVAAIAVTSFRRNLRNYFGPNPSSERRSSVGEHSSRKRPVCVTFTPYTTLSSALQPHARAFAGDN